MFSVCPNCKVIYAVFFLLSVNAYFLCVSIEFFVINNVIENLELEYYFYFSKSCLLFFSSSKNDQIIGGAIYSENWT